MKIKVNKNFWLNVPISLLGYFVYSLAVRIFGNVLTFESIHLYFLSMFVIGISVVLHELGHLTLYVLNGVKVESIEFHKNGGKTNRVKGIVTGGFLSVFFTIAAGPLVTLYLALFSYYMHNQTSDLGLVNLYFYSFLVNLYMLFVCLNIDNPSSDGSLMYKAINGYFN